MYKKNICATLLIMVICMTPSFVFASKSNAATSDNKVVVQWVGVTSATCSLSISSDEALSYVNLSCKDSTINSANFIIDLQQYKSGKWVSLKKWNVTKVVKYNNAAFDQSFSVEKGYKYRCKGTIKTYTGSTLSETISVASSTKSY